MMDGHPRRIDQCWRLTEMESGDQHITPELDIFDHEMTNRCLCGPRCESLANSMTQFVHHSMDGRELLK